MEWLKLETHDEYWYRYDDIVYSNGFDEWGDSIISDYMRVEVDLKRFPVTKRTPKGVWLDYTRFVLNSSRKRYACPTIEEARESYIARKNAQIRILKAQLNRAESGLQIMEKMVLENNNELQSISR
jgi:hypothetical protein